jgi:SAM-dependent methyltransferase
LRLKLEPTRPLEWLALRSSRAAFPVGDVWLPILQARALMAGVRLGVFEALGSAPGTSSEIAARCRLEPGATAVLLRLLACTRYVHRRRDGTYRATRAARRFLCRRSPLSLAELVEFMYLNLDWLGSLEDTLRRGPGQDLHERLRGQAEWRSYRLAMRDAARLQAPLLARAVPVPAGAARLLDVGGSHGLFAAALCARSPSLRADVLELPEAMPDAELLAAEHGPGSRLRYRAGDATRDDLGSDYDVALLANLLHHFPAPEARRLLERLRAAVRGGGILALWDFERPQERRRPDLIGDAMALLFMATSRGGVPTVEDYLGWLEASGWREPRLRRFLAAPGQVLVIARA